jgi:hypothetical protein
MCKLCANFGRALPRAMLISCGSERLTGWHLSHAGEVRTRRAIRRLSRSGAAAPRLICRWREADIDQRDGISAFGGPIHQHVIASKGDRFCAIVWSVVKDGGNRFTAVDVHGRVENATRQ